MPGGPDTHIGYGQVWANVSNTPFREYKHWQQGDQQRFLTPLSELETTGQKKPRFTLQTFTILRHVPLHFHGVRRLH